MLSSTTTQDVVHKFHTGFAQAVLHHYHKQPASNVHGFLTLDKIVFRLFEFFFQPVTAVRALLTELSVLLQVSGCAGTNRAFLILPTTTTMLL